MKNEMNIEEENKKSNAKQYYNKKLIDKLLYQNIEEAETEKQQEMMV